MPSEGSTLGALMIWPSFTWAVWMSAFILLYATTEGIVNGRVAGRNVDKSLRILNKLALRGSVWPEASAVAIEDLRSILTERSGIPPTPSSTAPRDDADQSRHAQTTLLRRTDVLNADDIHGSTSSSSVQKSRHGDVFRTQSTTAAQESPRMWPPNGNTTSWQEYQQAQIARPASQAPVTMQNAYSADAALDFHGADQNLLPMDVPPMAFGTGDPFQGFDIPFWFGQDNTVAWMGTET